MDAIVFLVDSADRDRLAEAKYELDTLLSDEGLLDIPFLILGNKIDIPNACSEEDLRHYLGLTNYTTGKGKIQLEKTIRPIEVFMCSVVTTQNPIYWMKPFPEGKEDGICWWIPMGVSIHWLNEENNEQENWTDVFNWFRVLFSKWIVTLRDCLNLDLMKRHQLFSVSSWLPLIRFKALASLFLCE